MLVGSRRLLQESKLYSPIIKCQISSNIACMSGAGDDGQADWKVGSRQQQQEPPPAQPHAGHLRLAGLRCEQTGH